MNFIDFEQLETETSSMVITFDKLKLHWILKICSRLPEHVTWRD